MHTLSVIVPFFALILVGYLATRSRFVPVESVSGLNTFVLYFALPATLFQFAARTPVAQLLDPTTVGLWIVSGVFVMAIAIATALWRKHSWLDASFGGLISVFSNSVFMGLPIIVALVGEYAAGPIVTTLLVDTVIMQSIALAFSQHGRGERRSSQARIAFARVISNPMPWAIILGAIWGATGFTMPGPINQMLDVLAPAATPVALFTIGAVLARESIRNAQAGNSARRLTVVSGDVPWLTTLKLLVHPAIVWVVGASAISLGLPLSAQDLVALILVAALPSAANVSMLAERLGADNGRIARVILLSTLVGFGTFTAIAIIA